MNRQYHYAATFSAPAGFQTWMLTTEARDATEANATAKIELERALAKAGATKDDLQTFDLVYSTP